MKDIQHKIADISGSWLDYLKIGETEYWNVKNGITPRRAQFIENPLPSDSRFREDLIWVHHNDLNRA